MMSEESSCIDFEYAWDLGVLAQIYGWGAHIINEAVLKSDLEIL